MFQWVISLFKRPGQVPLNSLRATKEQQSVLNMMKRQADPAGLLSFEEAQCLESTQLIVEEPREEAMDRITSRQVDLKGSRVLLNHWADKVAELLVQCNADLDNRGFPVYPRRELVCIFPGTDNLLRTEIRVTVSCPHTEGEASHLMWAVQLPVSGYSVDSSQKYEDLQRNKAALQTLEWEHQELERLSEYQSVEALWKMLQEGKLYVHGEKGRLKKVTAPVSVRDIMNTANWDTGRWPPCTGWSPEPVDLPEASAESPVVVSQKVPE